MAETEMAATLLHGKLTPTTAQAPRFTVAGLSYSLTFSCHYRREKKPARHRPTADYHSSTRQLGDVPELDVVRLIHRCLSGAKDITISKDSIITVGAYTR